MAVLKLAAAVTGTRVVTFGLGKRRLHLGLFGRQDLPVMRLLKNASESDLPFLKLFYKINLTHTRGLDVPEE